MRTTLAVFYGCTLALTKHGKMPAVTGNLADTMPGQNTTFALQARHKSRPATPRQSRVASGPARLLQTILFAVTGSTPSGRPSTKDCASPGMQNSTICPFP